MEYAIESAALFNPSMVPALDQTGLPPGSMRFLMSLRTPARDTSHRLSFAAASSTQMAGSLSIRPANTAGLW